jgi:hypothetical protein
VLSVAATLRIVRRLQFKETAIHIEFGKNYIRPLCYDSICIIGEEGGGASDGRWLDFQQLHRKVILLSQRLCCRIVGSNPAWITFSFARWHSNPRSERIGNGALAVIGGARLSVGVPMRFDSSKDRVTGIH